MNWITELDKTGPRTGEEGTRTPWVDAGLLPLNELRCSELILHAQANHYGTLFGPNALALLGKTAFLVAARYCQQPVVMAAARQIEFMAPVPVGALLNLHARVMRVGRSSMSVEVRAALDAAPGTRPPEVLRGEFEMVTVDEHGRPCPVSPPAHAVLPLPANPPAQELALHSRTV